ncbi:hypothetical protein R1sor_010607 [Riccia sorocarpa]|uniref:Equilibrative nucleotide transporter 1 n=1 Tax=Riccia sorocarpa TaxID=122646 RepID=A0ABD3HZY7_9MARC
MGFVRSKSIEKLASEGAATKDVANLALATYFAMGVCYLLPWNAFITAVDYFDYLYPNSHIDRVFSVSYLLPCLVTLCVVLVYEDRTSSRLRINLGLALLLSSTLAVPFIDIVVLRGDGGVSNSIGHVTTVLAVVGAGIGDALVQGTLIGVAGELPDRYMQAIVSGTGVCGVLISVLRILTKAAVPQGVHGLRTSANIYFSIGSGVIILCIIGYNQVHRLTVREQYGSAKSFDSETQDLETPDSSSLLDNATYGGSEITASLSGSAENATTSLMAVFVKLRWLTGSFILIYVVTLSIFPGFLTEDVHSAFLGDWYGILLLTTFNVFDLVGKSGTILYTPETPLVTVVGSAARLLFYPLFAGCLHGPKAFRTEVPVFLLTGLLGITNGYFTSTGFIIAPKVVAPDEIERAGTLMVIFLVVGLTVGSFVYESFRVLAQSAGPIRQTKRSKNPAFRGRVVSCANFGIDMKTFTRKFQCSSCIEVDHSLLSLV